MSATERTKPYCSAFMVRSAAGELFPNAICRLDGRDLSTMSYEFGAGEYCGEPVVLDCIGGPRAKYLVTPVYSAASKRSSFALLDMEDISTGPVARIHLRHHVPVSFHGYWLAGPE
jgi:all-trans-8'-apo-beta-carotenal 15,15'-oxygenase